MKRKMMKEENSVGRIQAIKNHMKECFLEMGEIVDGLFITLLAEQNILLVGPPGTAKTMIAHYLSKAFGGKFFQRLMHKFMTPDELFGPIDLMAMRSGSYKRSSINTLMDADFFLADEIWKASSAINNTLLTAINEKRYAENGKVIKLPLKMAIACSNEYPSGEETGAIYDRWVVRFETRYIQEDSNFVKLMSTPDQDPEPPESVSIQELETLIELANNLDVSSDVVETITNIRRTLEKNGIIISNRRWKKALRLVKACAVLEGRDHVEDDDLAFLKNVLWDQSEQRDVVKKVLLSIINPLNTKAVEILDMALEVMKNLGAISGDASKELTEARGKLVRMKEELKSLVKQAESAGKNTDKISTIADRIHEMQREVVNRLLN